MHTQKMRNLTRLLVDHFFEVIHICKDLNLFQKFLKTVFIKNLFIEGKIVAVNCILHWPFYIFIKIGQVKIVKIRFVQSIFYTEVRIN